MNSLQEARIFRVRTDSKGSARAGMMAVVIYCTKKRCTSNTQRVFRKDAAFDQIVEGFQRHGWTVDPDGSKAACPKCQRSKNMEEKRGHTFNGAASVPLAAAPAPSVGAMVAHVAAVRLLDEHFDKESGLYREGWSDARVAKETQLAPPAVAELRERGGWGKLAVEPGVAAVRKALEDLDRKFESDLAQHAAMLEDTRSEYRKAVAALRLKVEDATKGRRPT